MREKLLLIFDTLLVLSFQVVFRAMNMARHSNHLHRSRPKRSY